MKSGKKKWKPGNSLREEKWSICGYTWQVRFITE